LKRLAVTHKALQFRQAILLTLFAAMPCGARADEVTPRPMTIYRAAGMPDFSLPA
jgi:hypothetical protein